MEEGPTLKELKSKVKREKEGGLRIKIMDYADILIPNKDVHKIDKIRKLLQSGGVDYMTAFCDGGWKSREDVGASGVCLVIHDAETKDNIPLLSLGVKLSKTTNNQCEHLAIIFALILFQQLGLKKCSILSDSDLAIC